MSVIEKRGSKEDKTEVKNVKKKIKKSVIIFSIISLIFFGVATYSFFTTRDVSKLEELSADTDLDKTFRTTPEEVGLLESVVEEGDDLYYYFYIKSNGRSFIAEVDEDENIKVGEEYIFDGDREKAGSKFEDNILDEASEMYNASELTPFVKHTSEEKYKMEWLLFLFFGVAMMIIAVILHFKKTEKTPQKIVLD